MPYACRYTDSLAADICLAITKEHPDGGVKHNSISLDPTSIGSFCVVLLIFSLSANKSILLIVSGLNDTPTIKPNVDLGTLKLVIDRRHFP